MFIWPMPETGAARLRLPPDARLTTLNAPCRISFPLQSARSVELPTSVRERSLMKRFIATMALVLGIGFLTHTVLGQRAVPVAAVTAVPASSVSQALEQEMKRAFDLLKQKGTPAPYFISYSVRENQSIDIEASLGALRSS